MATVILREELWWLFGVLVLRMSRGNVLNEESKSFRVLGAWRVLQDTKYGNWMKRQQAALLLDWDNEQCLEMKNSVLLVSFGSSVLCNK